ncbi:MAG TPA: M20/M25/M40 family metallo-hydrolase, partial [bacterium]|nr:M20/M25/M40 family metallo-hydrolase [bacterium]
MNDVFGYIDEHRQQFIERLQWLCRQPSIAAQNIGIQETARMVAQLMEQVGVKTELYATDGAPVVYGVVGVGPRTLLIYNHYDVQPPEPLGEWQSPPFAAEIRDGKLYARGVADNKGNLVARLSAVEAWLQTRGALPLTVKFVVEGEEETSSEHLYQFVRQHQDLIKADGCLWEAGGKDIQENPGIYMGAKGILYV